MTMTKNPAAKQLKQKTSKDKQYVVKKNNNVLESAENATQALLRKIPPNSFEAEQGILNGILSKNTTLHALVDILTPKDFYFPAHQILFSAFLELYKSNLPIDLISTAELLKSNNMLESVGGSVYLSDLVQSVVTGANAEYYATIVRDKSIQRSLISTCSEIISNCFESTNPLDSLLDESEQALFAISERKVGRSFKSVKELIPPIFKELQDIYERKEQITGIPTGYTYLDILTAGLHNSDLIIIAARPAMGKTAFSVNMAMNIAIHQKIPVVIYSLEMSTRQLMLRMLCALGKIKLSQIRQGYITDEDWIRIHNAVNILEKAPIFIDDTPALSPLELRARTRRIKADSNIGLVVIDYLQLMKGARRTDSREQEISEISRSLKSLAKELDIPIVALSQLNRKLEDRTDKRPMLSDLRESGAIEQDADLIMFIYRDEVYNKQDTNPHKGTAEIIIGKQRSGPVGSTTLAYVGDYTSFEELAKPQYTE